MSKNETTLDLDSIPIETGDENAAQQMLDSTVDKYLSQESFKGRKTSLFEEEDLELDASKLNLEDDDFEIVVEGQEPEPTEEKAKPAPTEDKPKSETKPQPTQETQRKSRAKDRIQELANEKKRLEKENEEYRKQLQEKSSQALSAKQESLKGSLDAIKKELRIAKENADIDKEIELTEKLQQTVFSLAVLEANKNKVDEEISRPEPKQEPESTKAPQQEDDNSYAEYYDEGEERNVAAEEWFTKNAFWMSRDAEKKALALQIDKELVAEGKIPFTSPAYFEELDRRLDEKLNPKVKQNPPPVAGTSRSSAPGVSSKPKVVLTAEDKRVILKYNLDPKQYARNKLAQETNTRTSFLQ